jgi:hypothetical protein
MRRSYAWPVTYVTGRRLPPVEGLDGSTRAVAPPVDSLVPWMGCPRPSKIVRRNLPVERAPQPLRSRRRRKERQHVVETGHHQAEKRIQSNLEQYQRLKKKLTDEWGIGAGAS